MSARADQDLARPSCSRWWPGGVVEVPAMIRVRGVGSRIAAGLGRGGLAIVLVIDLERMRGTENRALLPGLRSGPRDGARLGGAPVQAAIHVARRTRVAGKPAHRCPRTPASVAHVPAGTPARSATVLAALRGARWHSPRRADAGARDAGESPLVGERPCDRHRRGRSPALIRRWIVDDGPTGVVVDGWVRGAPSIAIYWRCGSRRPLANNPPQPDDPHRRRARTSTSNLHIDRQPPPATGV